MISPAEKITLSEVDSEIALLGSLFMAPETFGIAAGEIRSEWLSDPMLRYMFEAALDIHGQGSRLSPQALVSRLPEDCGGIPRGNFYARVCASAMPATAIPGIVGVVKDRWARRELMACADTIKARADMFAEDPHELAGDIVLALDGVNGSKGRTSMRSLETAMIDLREGKSIRQGVTTGLLALDRKFNGYVPGQLYVIAGRPGMGKSAFMCSSLARTAQMNKGIAIFSLEMKAEEIGARILADSIDDVRGATFGDILRRNYDKWQEDQLQTAQDSLGGLPIIIEDAPRLTFSEIAAKSRQAKSRFEAQGIPLSVVCIDHMGLVTPSNRYAGNKVAEAGEVSGQARALAKELDCCVVLLCQLSREVEKRDDKRPVMSDLRWSGEIEQDAHVIGFLYREAYYLSQDPNAMPHDIQAARFKLDFLIRKNRNGETADVPLWCSIGHSSIRDDA